MTRDKVIAAIAGAFGALLVVSVMGAARAEKLSRTVKAERFEVVDKDGNLRAALAVEDGGGAIALLDAAGKQRVVLWASSTASRLTLFDSDGQARVNCIVPEDGKMAMVVVNDKYGSPKAVLGELKGKGAADTFR